MRGYGPLPGRPGYKLGWPLCITALDLLAVSENDDPRIVLRNPAIGAADTIVSHPGQPEPYINEQGTWEQTDRSTNWHWVGYAHLRVYDLIAPATR